MSDTSVVADIATIAPAPVPKRGVVILAWAITILLSALPNILWQETMHRGTQWLFPGKLILVTGLLAGAVFVRPLRSLAPYVTRLSGPPCP